jgi:hypothetical protein
MSEMIRERAFLSDTPVGIAETVTLDRQAVGKLAGLQGTSVQAEQMRRALFFKGVSLASRAAE